MNLRQGGLLCAGMACAVLLLPIPLSAQSSQATLQGQIIGQPGGKAVVKALVIERNLQTNSQSYQYTNEQGFYLFPTLLPGMYSVRVDEIGRAHV